MRKRMLEEVGRDPQGFLDYALNINQHWNELRSWILGEGVGVRVGERLKERGKIKIVMRRKGMIF